MNDYVNEAYRVFQEFIIDSTGGDGEPCVDAWGVSSPLCTTHGAAETHADRPWRSFAPPATPYREWCKRLSRAIACSVLSPGLCLPYGTSCGAQVPVFCRFLAFAYAVYLYKVCPLYGASSHLSAARGTMDN